MKKNFFHKIINQLGTVVWFVRSTTSVALQDTSFIAQMSLHESQRNSQSDYVRKRMDIVSLQTYYPPNVFKKVVLFSQLPLLLHSLQKRYDRYRVIAQL